MVFGEQFRCDTALLSERVFFLTEGQRVVSLSLSLSLSLSRIVELAQPAAEALV